MLAVLSTGIMSVCAGAAPGIQADDTDKLSPAFIPGAPSTANDSTGTSIRQAALKARKDSLEKEIKIQDGKRNAGMPGVSAETMEAVNNRQDSICLALRSELVDVILEIKEISPQSASPHLMQQINNLISRKEEAPSNEDDPPVPSASPAPANEPEN